MARIAVIWVISIKIFLVKGKEDLEYYLAFNALIVKSVSQPSTLFENIVGIQCILQIVFFIYPVCMVIIHPVY